MIVTPSFSKNVFRPHLNAKRTFSNSSGLKGIFEKLRSVDGKPSRRNKALFSNFSVVV